MSDSKSKIFSALMASTMLTAAGTALAQETGSVGQPLTPEAEDVVVVRGAYIPDEKRVTSEITSVMDSEDFTATGDSDIAAALVRMPGISVADDKFAIVRGLNDRYSNTILNGSLVSSPEPLRRAVPLDLFPTSMIGSAVVQKTYAPEFGLDFGGGLIAIETVTLPTEGFVQIGASTALNSATTLRWGRMYHGGGESDYTGFDDGRRNLPESFNGGLFRNNKLSDLSDAQIEQIGVELADWTDFVMVKGDISPDAGASFEAGERFDINPDFSIGVLAAGSYSSEWRTKEGVAATARLGAGNVLQPRDSYDRISTEHTIDTNAMLSVGADIYSDHQITATAMMARSTLKEARSLEGFNASEGRDVRIDNTEWYERQVWLGQLQGEHVFPELHDLSLNWRASYSEAERDAPYNRQVWYTPSVNPLSGETEYRYLGRREDNVTEFSMVEDMSRDLGVDAMLPVTFGNMDIELKAGYAYYDKLRDTTVRQFNFSQVTDSSLLFSRIDAILSPANVQAGVVELSEPGGILFPDNFRGLMEIDAAYVGMDAQLTDYVRIAVGGRYEKAIQLSDAWNVGSPGSGIARGETITDYDSAVDSEYFFPAATLTWNFAEDVQLRLAYSQTIARPQFRETAFAVFKNTETDSVFRGNPYLTNSEFENYDARLEYYFGREQFITLGAFYKDITNPIEEFNISLGETFASSFLNAPAAELYGFEFEFEKLLPLADWFGMQDWDFVADRDWVFKTNYTYTQSEVSADGQISIAQPVAGQPDEDIVDASSYIVDGRNLQGLSEHLFNLQFGYRTDNATATIVANFTGERIRTTENLAAGLPAIVEEPPLAIDFVYTRDFMLMGGDYSLGFKVQNILDEGYSATQSDGTTSLVVDGYDIGRTFSLSVKRSF